ncbi:MAG: sensor histidine kinase, partial [Solirubrobacteraceae bacterium]
TIHSRLVTDAQRAAVDLARASGGDGEGQGSSGESEDRYLAGRAASDTLLLTLDHNGKIAANSTAARSLLSQRSLPPGQHREITLNNDQYLVAASRLAEGGVALAAVPRAAAEAEIGRLLRAMLVVGLIALVPTVLIAWLTAGRALAPLKRVAGRASRITAGDLSERVGPVSSQDEVATLTQSIDAMLDRLERAFEAQTRLVHDASHELRTPLTIARGQLEVALLHHGRGSPELSEAIELAIGEIDRMGRLVESLLQLARVEGGGLRRRPVPIAEVARESLDRARGLGDRRWTLDLDGAGDSRVVGDRDALAQVLINLLGNAVRHTHEGGSIAVRARLVEGAVQVEVADDGEGIPPDALPRIFDRFTRADAARTRSGGGAGLGLAICREIVQAHGGTIEAHSEVGHGARFVLNLPVSAAGR